MNRPHLIDLALIHPTGCEGSTSYYNKEMDYCVAKCPAGQAPNVHKECAVCEGDTPYADHTLHRSQNKHIMRCQPRNTLLPCMILCLIFQFT